MMGGNVGFSVMSTRDSSVLFVRSLKFQVMFVTEGGLYLLLYIGKDTSLFALAYIDREYFFVLPAFLSINQSVSQLKAEYTIEAVHHDRE